MEGGTRSSAGHRGRRHRRVRNRELHDARESLVREGGDCDGERQHGDSGAARLWEREKAGGETRVEGGVDRVVRNEACG